MDFLIVLGIIIILGSIMAANAAKATGGIVDGKFVIHKKQCPPHKWSWQEIVDQDGNKQGERIVCEVCGPLASQTGRD